MASYGLSVYGNDPDHIVTLATTTDRAGFDRIGLGEHVVAPVGFESAHSYPRPGERPPITATVLGLADAR